MVNVDICTDHKNLNIKTLEMPITATMDMSTLVQFWSPQLLLPHSIISLPSNNEYILDIHSVLDIRFVLFNPKQMSDQWHWGKYKMPDTVSMETRNRHYIQSPSSSPAAAPLALRRPLIGSCALTEWGRDLQTPMYMHWCWGSQWIIEFHHKFIGFIPSDFVGFRAWT